MKIIPWGEKTITRFKMKSAIILFYIFLISWLKTSGSERQLKREKRLTNAKRPGAGVKVETLLDPDIYHKYIRPGVAFKHPLQVNVSIVVTNLDKISDVDMEYSVTFTLFQSWVDERLKGKIALKKPVTMDGSLSDRLWVPDTYMVNSHNSFIHDVTTKNGLVTLYPNQTLIYLLRITSRASCPMKLHKYPMDEQVCKLILSSWSFSDKDLVYNWYNGESCGPNGSVTGVQDMVLPQFNITKCQVFTILKTRILGNYSQLVLEFGLKRNMLFFIMQTYLPSILLVILSWISFWINIESVPARASMGATTVLSMTTLMIGVYGNGPKSTSYVKAIDYYVFVCYGFVFMALVEYAGAHHALQRCTARAKCIALSRSLKKFKSSNRQNNYQEKKLLSNKASLFRSPSVNIIGSRDLLCDVEKGHDKQNVYSFSGTINPQLDESDAADEKLEEVYWMKEKVKQIDSYSRIAYPMCFLIFNALYWWLFLTMED